LSSLQQPIQRMSGSVATASFRAKAKSPGTPKTSLIPICFSRQSTCSTTVRAITRLTGCACCRQEKPDCIYPKHSAGGKLTARLFCVAVISRRCQKVRGSVLFACPIGVPPPGPAESIPMEPDAVRTAGGNSDAIRLFPFRPAASRPFGPTAKSWSAPCPLPPPSLPISAVFARKSPWWSTSPTTWSPISRPMPCSPSAPRRP